MYDHPQRHRKRFWQNSAQIYDRNTPESAHRENIPQHSKAIYNKVIANTTLGGENWKHLF